MLNVRSAAWALHWVSQCVRQSELRWNPTPERIQLVSTLWYILYVFWHSVSGAILQWWGWVEKSISSPGFKKTSSVAAFGMQWVELLMPCQHSTSALGWVQAAWFLIQIPAIALGKAAESAPVVIGPGPDGFPDWNLAQSWLLWPFKEWVNR